MKIFSSAGAAVVEMLKILLYTLKREYRKILGMVQLCIPVFIYWYCNNLVEAFLFSVGLHIALEFFKRYFNKLSNYYNDGFPRHDGRRFTGIYGGMIVLDRTREEEAILYLSEVEDYMEMREEIGRE